MRLLFVCRENPWRLDGGAAIRNAWLVRSLARRFEVVLVTAGDPKEPVEPSFGQVCRAIHRFPPPSQVMRVVRASRPGATIYTSGAVSRAMRAGVAELLRTHQPRAIVLDLAMIDAIPPGCAVPLVYNAHNCETALLSRRARCDRGVLRRLVTGIDARRLAPRERQLVERAAIVAACSPEDVDDLLDLAPDASSKMVVVANGVDVERYAEVVAAPAIPGRLLITGRFDWQPNLLGLQWFFDQVYPELRAPADAGEVHVRVAGRMGPGLAEQLRVRYGVHAAPNVADMRNELACAETVVAPIVASSGTRLRILEGWAAGRPVVTTPAGAFGLAYEDDVDLVVRGEPRAFAAALLALARDPQRRASLRSRGLARAATYEWRRIGDTLLRACEQFDEGTGDGPGLEVPAPGRFGLTSTRAASH